MTITLAPENEKKLRETAQREGQEADIVANLLLSEVFAQREQEYADDVAAIHEAMEDVEAGRVRPFKEFMAEHRQRYPGAASA